MCGPGAAAVAGEIKRVPLEQVGRIRMKPEKLPSLVDITSILCEKRK
jgi:hypothetical protein